MHVRALDLGGADFGEVHIGDADQPALIVRSIQLDYTAGGLVQKKIKKVTANGIELFCEFENGRFGFRGVELESLIQRLQSRLDATPAPAPAGEQSLLALERLELRDVTLNLRINSTTYRISADIDIIPENMAFDRITSTAVIYSRGHRMTLSADFDLENKTNILNFSAQNLILARFADLTEAIDGLHLSGRANIDAKAKFSTESLEFSSFSSVIDLLDIDMQMYGYQLQNRVDQNNEKHPWRVHLEAITADEWKMNASEITISGPLSLDLSQLNFK
jgi:hypothetical protein